GGAVTIDASTGAFTYTPTRAQRQTCTPATTDTITVIASNGVHSTPTTVTVRVDAGIPQVTANAPTVGGAAPITGAVHGSVTGARPVFIDPAGRTLTYGADDTSDGGGTVAMDSSTGAFTYTPSQDQRRAATASTTDFFTITANNGVH